jgi:hypothetical protein
MSTDHRYSYRFDGRVCFDARWIPENPYLNVAADTNQPDSFALPSGPARFCKTTLLGDFEVRLQRLVARLLPGEMDNYLNSQLNR